jgi:pimeloyl-ACP methyl ester carboxylesterase
MRKVYFISGLGADSTVFEGLDLSFCEPIFLNWIKPLKKESLQHYALRLAESIKKPDAIIVGLSMGGMMATEIVKANPQMKAIIISSNRNSKEFPSYSRFVTKYVPLYKLVNKRIMNLIFPIMSWFLGAKTKDEKRLLKGVIQRTDIPFVKWCIWSIAHWKNESKQRNIIHIHGTGDKLLPYRYVNPDHTIEGGEHLMIRNRASEISDLLRKLISN